MMRWVVRIVVVVAAVVLLAGILGGCAAQEKGPGIGSGTDDYKQSPCACRQVPQRFKHQYVG